MLARVLKYAGLIVASALAGPAVVALPPPPSAPRIVAVGDLHGDFAVWRDIATAAHVIGSDGHWTGGRTTLVQVGDVVDRAPDSLKIIRELMKLQKEAPKAGGRVIVLVGNHEAMNLTGDLRYVTPGEFASYATPNSAALRDRLYEAKKADIEAKYRAEDPSQSSASIRAEWIKATPLGWTEQRLAWTPTGEIGSWVVRNPAVANVGGNLFVHGGLSAEYAKRPIADINREVAAALASTDRSAGSILTSPLGPLWYRGLVTRDPKLTEIPAPAAGAPARPAIEQELGQVLAAYGAKRIIVGHTPNLAGIQVQFDGRLVRIDTGNSRYYGGTPSYLEIIGDRLVPHAVARSAAAGGKGGEGQ